MAEYKLVRDFKAGPWAKLPPGTMVELSEADAVSLLANGHIEPVVEFVIEGSSANDSRWKTAGLAKKKKSTKEGDA